MPEILSETKNLDTNVTRVIRARRNGIILGNDSTSRRSDVTSSTRRVFINEETYLERVRVRLRGCHCYFSLFCTVDGLVSATIFLPSIRFMSEGFALTGAHQAPSPTTTARFARSNNVGDETRGEAKGRTKKRGEKNFVEAKTSLRAERERARVKHQKFRN